MNSLKVVSVVLLGCLFTFTPAQAADSCTKECAAFHRACVKAHSKEACKVDYEICVKHCVKQN